MVLAIGFSASANAHFLMTTDLRVVHVSHVSNGLRVHMRVPMSLVLAKRPSTDANVEPYPYALRGIENEQLVHYVDIEKVKAEPEGLGQLVADSHHLVVKGRRLRANVEAVRVHTPATQPGFSTLEEARGALVGPVYPDASPSTYVGDAVIDVALFYRLTDTVSSYELSSSALPELPGVNELRNIINDHRGDATHVYQATGGLQSPVIVDPSPWSAAVTFIVHGFEHIIGGLDHVLFVLCLTVGAAGLTNLVYRITGFTLGHTLSLSAGFLGFAPTWTWFIPAVEIAIALSIIYAGAIAIVQRPVAATFAVTTAIGLLHGFGFSFVLREILQVDAPNLAVSLLSFNVGVELGQLAIVASVWLLLYGLRRYHPRSLRYSQVTVAVACIAVAAFWTWDRMAALVQQPLS